MVPFRNVELNNAFSLSYLIAYAAIVGLGRTVRKNAHVKRMHSGG